MIEYNVVYFNEILLYHIPTCTIKRTGYSEFSFQVAMSGHAKFFVV